MLRRIILFLVLALPVLLVAFAVVMAGFGLTSATDDLVASRVLWWMGMGCLMLTAVDLVLLIATIGVAVVAADDEVEHPPPSSRE